MYNTYQPRRDFPISATTPINRRVSLNHQNYDTRDKHQISVQEPAHNYDYDERVMPRSRGNSASGFKKSMEKPVNRHTNSHFTQ